MGEIERFRAELRAWLAAPARDDAAQQRLPDEAIDLVLRAAAPSLDFIEHAAGVDAFSYFAPGAARIGGWPDLPPDLDWPWRPAWPNAPALIARTETRLRRSERLWEEEAGADPEAAEIAIRRAREEAERYSACISKPHPLWFVAQYDFGALNSDGWLGPDYPTSGRLLLFYDTDVFPAGDAPHDAIGHRVIWDETPPERLSPRAPPSHLAENRHGVALPGKSEAVSLSFRRALAVPPPEILMLGGARAEGQGGLGDLLGRALGRSRRPDHGAVYAGIYASGHRQAHRLGGWPFRGQGDMQARCVAVSPIESRCEDWVFLLQQRDETWGSGDGLLHLWIHREDLRARRFDRTRLFLQSA